MKRLIIVISAVLCFTLSEAEHQEDQRCFLLQKHSAGQLKIGMNSKELYTLFDKKYTKFVDLYIEGHYCPAIEIYLRKTETEKPSLVAEITQKDNWTVWRIRVYDTRYKTAKDIGVGSTIGEIRKVYNVIWRGCGEDVLCARVNDIMMRFVIDFAPRNWYKDRNPESIPDSTLVTSIQIDKR